MRDGSREEDDGITGNGRLETGKQGEEAMMDICRRQGGDRECVGEGREWNAMRCDARAVKISCAARFFLPVVLLTLHSIGVFS